MYVDIDTDSLVNGDDVVCIFDLDNTTVNKFTNEFLNKMQAEGKIEYLVSDIPKCFILMKIYKQNIVGRYTKHIVKYITRSIVNTYYFNDKYIEDYRKYIVGNSNESHMICVLIQFLNFIGEASAYIQLLKGFKCNKKVNRDIPGFESIIMFDKIVDDVILHHKELYQRFYSILLY